MQDHLIPGLICDRGLTLGDLKGVLRSFFARLGIHLYIFLYTFNYIFHAIFFTIKQKYLMGGFDFILFYFYVWGCVGISKLRFKPAYNPYTEPSMEIFR